MDLSMIITHLDNFVDTWEGWTKVLAGAPEVLHDIYQLSSNATELSWVRDLAADAKTLLNGIN